MDLFGEAIYNLHKNNSKEPLYFTYKSISSQKTKKNIKRYFRKFWQLTNLEKTLIKTVRGKTLDIGCATGYYIPYMQKYGEVIGIDISEKLISICHDKGVTNCTKQDIYEYNPVHKFDTITLLESNIGLGGSEYRLIKLLEKIKSLLELDGQVLCIQNNFEGEYLDCEIEVKYKDQVESITWSYMNMYYLKAECEKVGFRFEVIKHGKGNLYLAKLTL